MRFLNTKEHLHRYGNYMDTLCEPSEAFRLTGHGSTLPVPPPQGAGSLFACVIFATAELWDASSEGDHILEGFDPSALCRQLFSFSLWHFYSAKIQSLRFLSQATLLHVSSHVCEKKFSYTSLFPAKLQTSVSKYEDIKAPREKVNLHSLTWPKCGQGRLLSGFIFTHCFSIMTDTASKQMSRWKI